MRDTKIIIIYLRKIPNRQIETQAMICLAILTLDRGIRGRIHCLEVIFSRGVSFMLSRLTL